jgi:hypothetical protein
MAKSFRNSRLVRVSALRALKSVIPRKRTVQIGDDIVNAPPRTMRSNDVITAGTCIDIRYDRNSSEAKKLQGQLTLSRSDNVTVADRLLLGRILNLNVEVRKAPEPKTGPPQVTPDDVRDLQELFVSGSRPGSATDSPLVPKPGVIGYGPARLPHQHRLQAAFGIQPPFLYQTLNGQKHKNKYTSDGKLLTIVLHDDVVPLKDSGQSVLLAATLEWIVNVARSPLESSVMVKLLHEMHTASTYGIDVGDAPMSQIVGTALVDRCPSDLRDRPLKKTAPLRAIFNVSCTRADRWHARSEF